MSLGYRPIVYMWVAEYRDGSALPQFDPDTGKENPFSSIDQSRLCKFGWYPFSINMMGKILGGEDAIVALPMNNPSYSVELKAGEKLVAHRNNIVAQFKYRVCLKCDARWQFGRGEPRSMVNLPVSDKAFVEQFLVKTAEGKHMIDFVSPICPKCGYHDTNAVMMADKQVKRRGGEVRKTFYVLGIEGGEIKRIGEDGKVVN